MRVVDEQRRERATEALRASLAQAVKVAHAAGTSDEVCIKWLIWTAAQTLAAHLRECGADVRIGRLAEAMTYWPTAVQQALRNPRRNPRPTTT